MARSLLRQEAFQSPVLGGGGRPSCCTAPRPRGPRARAFHAEQTWASDHPCWDAEQVIPHSTPSPPLQGAPILRQGGPSSCITSCPRYLRPHALRRPRQIWSGRSGRSVGAEIGGVGGGVGGYHSRSKLLRSSPTGLLSNEVSPGVGVEGVSTYVESLLVPRLWSSASRETSAHPCPVVL